MPENGDARHALLPPGDPAGVERFVAVLYDDLSRLAHAKLRSERPDHTLDTVALVNEAYLKLADHTRVEWRSRSHFLAVAAISMRRILVDHAKAHNAERRGGGRAVLVTLDGQPIPVDGHGPDAVDLLELENSLNRLEAFNPRGARVVELGFFAGLTHEEIAEVLGVSVPTVRRSWAVARAWLAQELG
ncbi:MAG: ECF-type sigma factor [Longimicrobiales bacterium]|nr:ECF-type sigma factor [Longimicrobiales bacterium]